MRFSAFCRDLCPLPAAAVAATMLASGCSGGNGANGVPAASHQTALAKHPGKSSRVEAHVALTTTVPFSQRAVHQRKIQPHEKDIAEEALQVGHAYPNRESWGYSDLRSFVRIADVDVRQQHPRHDRDHASDGYGPRRQIRSEFQHDPGRYAGRRLSMKPSPARAPEATRPAPSPVPTEIHDRRRNDGRRSRTADPGSSDDRIGHDLQTGGRSVHRTQSRRRSRRHASQERLGSRSPATSSARTPKRPRWRRPNRSIPTTSKSK